MAFTFKLETADGTPADPPSLLTIAPQWRPGYTIPLGARTLEQVGHADLVTTARTYTHVLIAKDELDYETLLQ